MEPVGTVREVVAQVQHVLGLTTETMALLKAFFILVFVVTAAVIFAVVKFKDTWLPVVRGFARDHRESDPKLGNGSLRDDMNKAVRGVEMMVAQLGGTVTEIGGALVKSTGALHDRLDALVGRFEDHLVEAKPYMNVVDVIIREREAAKTEFGRELRRVSSPEERAQFRQEAEAETSKEEDK